MKNRNFNEMELPQHTSLTKDTFCYGTKENGDFWDYKERKWFSTRKVYSYIDRFWEKHVGENYNECHKKLICNLKEKFGYDDGSLYVIHTELNRISNKPRYWWDEFVVDDNGNILHNKRRYVKHPTVKVDNQVIHGYTFNKEDFNEDEIGVLINRLGKDKVNRLFTETITPEEYKKVYELLCGYWVCSKRVEIDRKAHPIIEGEVVEYGRGTSVYSQWKHESRDAYRKSKREERRKKLEKEESLLHDIIESRRVKERRENLSKILKHGFDEDESFRGEEYHGEKRKRK